MHSSEEYARIGTELGSTIDALLRGEEREPDPRVFERALHILEEAIAGDTEERRQTANFVRSCFDCPPPVKLSLEDSRLYTSQLMMGGRIEPQHANEYRKLQEFYSRMHRFGMILEERKQYLNSIIKENDS